MSRARPRGLRRPRCAATGAQPPRSRPSSVCSCAFDGQTMTRAPPRVTPPVGPRLAPRPAPSAQRGGSLRSPRPLGHGRRTGPSKQRCLLAPSESTDSPGALPSFLTVLKPSDHRGSRWRRFRRRQYLAAVDSPRPRLAPEPRTPGLSKFEGLWVAVIGDEVVAAEKSSHALALKLYEMDHPRRSRAVVEYVRPTTDSYIVGAG